MVAEVDRLSDGLEAHPALCQAGDGEDPRHRPASDDQDVVGKLVRFTDRGLDGAHPPAVVEVGDLTGDQADPAEHGAQGNHDMTGLDVARGGLGEERRVDHETLGAHEGDLGLTRAESLL